MLNVIPRLALPALVATAAVLAPVPTYTEVRAHTHTYTAAAADLTDDCESYEGCLVWDGDRIYADVEDAPEAFADDLLAAGFRGDPTDGRERLYAPSVLDVANAPEWVVEALKQAGYYGDPTDHRERLYAPTGG